MLGVRKLGVDFKRFSRTFKCTCHKSIVSARLCNSEVNLTVSLVVALALALTIILAKIIGATLPLLAKKIGLDPAVMASPLITTLVDAISLVVYMLVAQQIMPG